MNATLLRDLLDKYMSETASAQERVQLHELLKDDEYSHALAAIIDEDLRQQRYNIDAEENLREAILGRIIPIVRHELETGPAFAERPDAGLSKAGSVPMVSLRSRMIRRIAYAAAILVLFASAALVFKWSLHKPLPSPGAAVAIIPPGHDGAVLTLADGSTIVLDSAGNGAIASDANGTIMKTGDGALSYSAGAGQTASHLFNTLSTPAGRQFRVVLPDGSKVWLNAASSLRYPTAFAGQERLVFLTGEAYFEIASNSNMPFKVASPGQQVQVLGTHFNINAYANEASISTTLLEGRVNVMAMPMDSAGGALLPLAQAVLVPGQQSQFGADGNLKVVRADVEQAIAWKEGLFSFKKADLRAIMRQVERWYQVEVRYERNPGTETFTGKIGRNLSLQELMEGLAFTHVKYRIEARNRIVIE